MSRRPLARLPEVSEYTGLTRKSIYDQVHRQTGVGALAFKVGRHLRWDWTDIDAWIEQQKRGSAA